MPEFDLPLILLLCFFAVIIPMIVLAILTFWLKRKSRQELLGIRSPDMQRLAANITDEQALQHRINQQDIREAIGAQQDKAASLASLGYLADRQSNYAEACVYYEQSLLTFEAIGDQYRVAEITTKLAFVLLKMEDAQAPRTIAQALKRATEMQATPLILEALIGFGLLHVQRDEALEAAEIALVVGRHPALDSELQGRLKELQERLVDVLPPTAQLAVSEQVSQRTIEQLSRELLRIFAR